MNTATIRRITDSRLTGWADLLAREHATPALLVGIGHDHKSGDVVVCVCEEVPDEYIRAMLRLALKRLGG